jgi:hypothetical protein
MTLFAPNLANRSKMSTLPLIPLAKYYLTQNTAENRSHPHTRSNIPEISYFTIFSMSCTVHTRILNHSDQSDTQKTHIHSHNLRATLPSPPPHIKHLPPSHNSSHSNSKTFGTSHIRYSLNNKNNYSHQNSQSSCMCC